jgi:hypothetical protein
MDGRLRVWHPERMDSPEHERRHIIEYLRVEAPDEEVQHAEKIASERILGHVHDVWDVHTDKERWWVVTDLTNLYSQKDFKSMDGVLTFHIGLMARMLARQALKAPDRPAPQLERTRRQWEQAAKAQNDAEEAEEFQAVGMRCRETLVSFAHAMASDELVPERDSRPKDNDFVHWAELVAAAAVPGSRDVDAELRAYLRAIAKEAWDYVATLTHAKNATRIDGDLAVEVTAHVLAMFEQVIERQEMRVPDRCPSCASYRLAADWRFDQETEQSVQAQVCAACGWSLEMEPQPLQRPDAEPREPVIEGPRLPSSEL